jgi:1,4-dihydroxy-2-naphthoate octaprenyltransferase
MIACRPHTLTASLSPVLVGHCLLVKQTAENLSLSIHWLLFCVLIQLATNLHNDFADYIKGADTKERVGQARAVQKEWLTVDEVGRASTGCVILAGSVMMHLLYTTQQLHNVFLWCILLSSCFNAFAYTGGPIYYTTTPFDGTSSSSCYYNLNVSIGYSGLGDIFCFLYFGLVAVLLLPYLESLQQQQQQQHYDDSFKQQQPFLFSLLLVACPVGFLATAILVVNNVRDRHTDALARKRTLAVRFGATFCRIEYLILVVASYAALFVLYYYYYLNPQQSSSSTMILLPLLSLPLAIWNVRAMFTKEGSDLNKHVGGTAMLQFVYCVLLCVGIRIMNNR